MRSTILLLLLYPLLLLADEKTSPAPKPNAATVIAKAADAADAKPAAEMPAKKRQLTMEELKKFYTDEKDRITTDWVDSASRQGVYEAFKKAGYITVFSERKWENGEAFYRKAFKFLTDVYPDAEKVGCASYSGATKAGFDALNTELQNAGYILMQMQTSDGPDGEPRYCAVWVNPTGPRKK